MELGFGKCRLCVQAPVSSKITDPAKLAGKRIVTSFPRLSKKYFEQFGGDVPTSTLALFKTISLFCFAYSAAYFN
jgi:ATP phosphoribosyltransferase